MSTGCPLNPRPLVGCANRSKPQRNWRMGSFSSRPTKVRATSNSSARISPAPTTASRWRSWRRETSHSTTRTAPARLAPGSAASSRSTPTWGRSSYFYNDLVEAVAHRYKIPLDKAFGKLAVKERQIILYGNNGDPLRVKYFNSEGQRRWYETSYEGIIPNLERRYRETESEFIRAEIERLMSTKPCPVCKGKRLKPEYLAVTVDNRSIMDVCELSIDAAQRWFAKLQLPEREALIARGILKEIRERLQFLVDVGLDYLNLARSADSLSGGEAQRIRLACTSVTTGS